MLGIEVKDNMFRNFFYHDYLKTFLEVDLTDVVMQLFTIIILMMVGMLSLRLVGKKSISQLTLPNVLFVFLYTNALGGLVQKPEHLFIAITITSFIIIIVLFLEWLMMKVNWIERIFVGYPAILINEGKVQENALKKNKLSYDQLEGLVREKGIPSLQICKNVTLEPNGYASIELYQEYEPVRQIFFDEAMKQILEALGKEYKKADIPKMNNLFEEAILKRNENQEIEGGTLD